MAGITGRPRVACTHVERRARPSSHLHAAERQRQYSLKFWWPVALACSTASFSPLSPSWQTPHLQQHGGTAGGRKG